MLNATSPGNSVCHSTTLTRMVERKNPHAADIETRQNIVDYRESSSFLVILFPLLRWIDVA